MSPGVRGSCRAARNQMRGQAQQELRPPENFHWPPVLVASGLRVPLRTAAETFPLGSCGFCKRLRSHPHTLRRTTRTGRTVLTKENSFVAVSCDAFRDSLPVRSRKFRAGIDSCCKFAAVETTVVTPKCHGTAVG